MIIVAFGHRQRVGKDSASRMLLSLLSQMRIPAARLSFGDVVKEECVGLFGWAGLQDAVYYENNPTYVDRVLGPLDKTPRQIWLEYGYALSQISPKTIPEVALLQAGDAKVLVCSDLRRLVEIDYVRKFKGLAFRIDRDVPKVESIYTGHPAYLMDAQLDTYVNWDGIIKNDGTLRDLNCIIKTIANRVQEILT